MANPKTTFEFDGDVSKIMAKLTELEDKIGKAGKGGKGAGEDIAGGFGGAVGAISKATVALAAAYAALSGVQKAVSTAAEFEQLQVRLENMYGSIERGREAFQKFQEVAATTPYSLQGVVEAGASLKAFGVDAENMIKPVADLAAYMGIDVVEAAQAFGRAMAGGAGAADILRERGIMNLVKSFKGIDDLSKLTLPQFRKALIETIQDPTAGIVGATDKLSKTFTGAYSNMMDAVDQLANVMGKKLLPALTSVMQGVGSFVGGLLPTQSEQLRENQYEFNALASILKDVNTEQSTRNLAIKELQDKYGSYLGNIDLEKATYDELTKAINSVNLAIDQRIKMMAAEELLSESERNLAEKRMEIFKREVYLRQQMAKNPALNQNLIQEDPGLIWMRKGLDELTASHKALQQQVMGNSIKIDVEVRADRIIEPPKIDPEKTKAEAQVAGETFATEYKAILEGMDIAPPRSLDEWAAKTKELIEKQQTLNGKFKLIGEQSVPAADDQMRKMAEMANHNFETLQGHLTNVVDGMVEAGLAGKNMGEALKKALMEIVAKALTLAIVFGLMQLVPGGSAFAGSFGSFMGKGFGFQMAPARASTFNGSGYNSSGYGGGYSGGGSDGGGTGSGGYTSSPDMATPMARMTPEVTVQVASVLEGQKFVVNTVKPNEARLSKRSF